MEQTQQYPIDDKLHDARSAANFIRGSHWTIRGYWSRGILRRVKAGRKSLVWESDLRRFIEESTRKAEG